MKPPRSTGPAAAPAAATSPLDFFRHLVWLDRRPLLDTIEPYRKRIFADTLWTFDQDGRPRYNMVLAGRAKKNWKTSDLLLAALYRFMAWPSPKGNDCFILANDEGQAADDLDLAKKIIRANAMLEAEVHLFQKEIVRKDGNGALRILPARDAVGAHGKTYTFLGFDEIHGYRNYDLIEALAPDPSRTDALIWVTSYASVRHEPGIPLHDLMQAGQRGDDPRMYFSWYSGDYTTDPAAAELPPEERANPSLASWGNDGYLAQQKRRLPGHKFRRLHLNLPGAPEGAAFDADAIESSTVAGRKRLPYAPGTRYAAFVDMSGGSSDDAVLAIAHRDPVTKRAVLDLVMSQTGKPKFNPRDAVTKFVGLLKEYGITRVTGDNYAGETFKNDFTGLGIQYVPCKPSKSDLYDAFEPVLNAGEVELLDHPRLTEQLMTLTISRSGKIDHVAGAHDDFANAAVGAVWLTATRAPMVISQAALEMASRPASRSGLHW